jgi:hypothetical protein
LIPAPHTAARPLRQGLTAWRASSAAHAATYGAFNPITSGPAQASCVNSGPAHVVPSTTKTVSDA